MSVLEAPDPVRLVVMGVKPSPDGLVVQGAAALVLLADATHPDVVRLSRCPDLVAS